MSQISRRELLCGMGHAAAFGALAAALPRRLNAADSGDAAVLLSMNYANAPNAQFDAVRFGAVQLPLLRQIYGDSVERIELRVPSAAMMPAAAAPPKQSRSWSTPGSAKAVPKTPTMPQPPASPVLAAVSLWIRDVKGFAEKTAAARSQIAEGMAQIVSGSAPIVQYDRVLALLGDARDSIAVDSEVTSYYFTVGDGGQFDVKDYNDNVIPSMVKIYGEKALRRIEFSMGVKAESGGQPPVAAEAHYYIRDRAAWDQASMAGGRQLAAEAAKHPGIKRVRASMRIAAAG
jgi:hypothetical protein